MVAAVLRFGFPKPLERPPGSCAGKVIDKISKRSVRRAGTVCPARVIHNRAARIQRERIVKAEDRDIHPTLDGMAAGRIAQRLLDLPGVVGSPLRKVAVDPDGREIDVGPETDERNIGQRSGRGCRRQGE